jgi:hypothetical protein
MRHLLKKLEGGDRRSIGRVAEVVRAVSENKALIEDLVQGLFVKNPLVRMRAADALEKVTAKHPEYLIPHKSKIIMLAATTDQQELRWHIAQMAPRLNLTSKETTKVTNILFDYLHDKSNIVVTFALQALADFAINNNTLRLRVMDVLEKIIQTGSPAVKNRGKKLLAQLTDID